MSAAVVIPAYNEEKTIKEVIRACQKARAIDEVIVVSDGSTDHTADIARKEGVIVIEQKNEGKAQAMQRGVNNTKAEVVVFVDADLIGLRASHIDALARPVIEGKLDMCVGLRDRSILYRLIGAKLLKISGERALKKTLFTHLPNEEKKGFMIEIALNKLAKKKRLRVGTIFLKNLTMRKKYEKVSLLQATKQYVRMWKQIIYALIIR